MKTKLITIVLFVVLLFACKKETAVTPKNDSIAVNPTSKSTSVSNDTAVQQKQSLEDVYATYAKPAQIFTVLADKDIKLTCKEGTKITIKANSLVHEKTGKLIHGKVTVQITEYYKMSEMLMAQLSTLSDGHLLETAGMINIEAFANNEKLKLKQGATAKIEISTKKKKSGEMLLFNGHWKKNGIDWKQSPLLNTPIQIDDRGTTNLKSPEPDIIDESQIIEVPEQMAEFPGGMNALYEFINKTIVYPAAAKESGEQGKVIVSFIISSIGEICDIKVIKGVSYALNTEAVRIIQNMPNWKPASQGGAIVKSRFFLPIVFKIDDNYSAKPLFQTTNNFDFSKPNKVIVNGVTMDAKTRKKELEKKISKNDQSSFDNINEYIFRTTNLGWINCDRYVGYPKLINFKIKKEAGTTIDLYIVFKKINAIIKTAWSENECVVNNLPLGEPISIIAFKNENGKNFIATKETFISKSYESDLVYTPLTINILKKTMGELNEKR